MNYYMFGRGQRRGGVRLERQGGIFFHGDQLRANKNRHMALFGELLAICDTIEIVYLWSLEFRYPRARNTTRAEGIFRKRFLVSWPLGFKVSWFQSFLVSMFLRFLVSWSQSCSDSWFLGFLVSGFLGFLVSRFQSSLVSKYLCFSGSAFRGFKVSWFLGFKVRCFKDSKIIAFVL